MGGCICVHSHMTICFMSERFAEALSEEESSKRLRNAGPKTIRNTKLSGVFVYLNPGRKKDVMTSRMTYQLLNYCHTDNEKEYKPCIVKLFNKYMAMVNNLSKRNDAFYFRPFKTSYKFEDFPVGIHTLNSILPSLTTAAGLERKTPHSLKKHIH